MDQLGGDAHEAELGFQARLPEFVAPDGGHGQEGGAAAVPLLQKADGALGVLFPVHHDVLHAAAQGNFDGDGVFLASGHEAGHGAVDAPEDALFCGVHDHLDGLGEALVLLFHLAEEVDAGAEVVVLHGEVHLPLGGLFGAASAAVHFQAVALDDVGGGPFVLPGLVQQRLIGFGLGLGGGFLLLGAAEPFHQVGPALGGLVKAGLQCAELGAAFGGGGQLQGLLGTEGFGGLFGSTGGLGQGADIL